MLMSVKRQSIVRGVKYVTEFDRPDRTQELDGQHNMYSETDHTPQWVRRLKHDSELDRPHIIMYS